jgi:flagellar protein FlaG
VDLAAVAKAVASVKEALKPVGGGLEFNVDQSSGRTIVRVVDLETQQVIRQIPSEEMVRLARVLERLEGLLLNSRA